MTRHSTTTRFGGEDQRRRQLIDATIEALAAVGFAASSLSEIAGRAGVAPSLVAHYFGDKEGLLEATLRHLSNRVHEGARVRLARAEGPRERIQAVIEASLAPEEFGAPTGSVWLAFWGQVPHSVRLGRVQRVYQRRMLSNLRHDLKALVDPAEAARIAVAIAAVIDGLWLRASLSGSAETDSSGARRIASSFADAQIAGARPAAARPAPRPSGAGGVRRLAGHWGGDFARPCGREFFATVNPANGEVLAEIERAGAEDLRRAVEAARAAQRAWRTAPGSRRARVLLEVAARLRERAGDLARLESRDAGRPIRDAVADVEQAALVFETFAALASDPGGQDADAGPGAFGYTRREPLGLVAAEGSVLAPLRSACARAAPALAAGNAFLLLPSELAPLTALRLAEIVAECGVPPGLLAVLPGDARLRRDLPSDPAVARFQRSGDGEKAPLIVCQDADPDAAAALALRCAGASFGGLPVLVHEAVHADVLDRLRVCLRALRLGDPAEAATQVGPLASREHVQAALQLAEDGRREGARLLAGGRRALGGRLERGFFLEPALFDAPEGAPRIARERFPGPAIVVLRFTNEAEAVRRADALGSGREAGLVTRDLARAHRVAALLDARTVWINAAGAADAPAGAGTSARAALLAETREKRVHVRLETEPGDA